MSSLWLADQPLVLASRSAVRRTMIEAAGIPLEVAPADIDERAVEQRAVAGTAADAASLLAREKSRAGCAGRKGRLVVGADQTLALGRKRFTKPVDGERAREQLQALAGRTHELHSAVAVARDGRVLFSKVDTAKLTMRELSDDFLDAYLETAGESVMTSVGGYQLEGLGSQLFERIEGDYFTVLGLPLLPLLDYLRRGKLLAA
jgi:septum formation protein